MQKIVNILTMKPGDGTKELLFNNPEVKAARIQLASGQRAEDCIVDAPVIIFVLVGHGTLVLENERHPLTDGDVTVVPAGVARYLEAGDCDFQVLAVQSHQADKSCGLCALLEDCVSLKD